MTGALRKQGCFFMLIMIATTVKLMGSKHQQGKARILCLHGHGDSGEIMKTQVGIWPETVLQKFDLVFIDGPFRLQGQSKDEGVSDPPHYEWFPVNEDLTVYTNFEECLDYIEDCMIKQGPFDGLLGFSQGAVLAAALPGLQAQGVALKEVPKIKSLIIIAGGQMKDKRWADKAYVSPVQSLSLHFLDDTTSTGKKDLVTPDGEELLKCFIDPMTIYHPGGHEIPPLDDQSLPIMLSFIDKLQMIVEEDEQLIVTGDDKMNTEDGNSRES